MSGPKSVAAAGCRFGRLVLQFESGRNRHGKKTWRCLCDCGTRTDVTQNNIVSGGTKSCGCLKIETTISRNLKHGQSYVGAVTPEYSIWLGMKDRCNNQNSPGYWNYGRRGISVCQDWQDSFEVFLHDMGLKPSPKHSIERLDNDSGYTPKNCVWATRRDQIKNRRVAAMVQIDGEDVWLPEACEQAGLSYKTVRSRMDKGWPEDLWFKPAGYVYRKKPGRKSEVFVTYQGEHIALSKLAERSGLQRATIRTRIKNGWPETEWLRPPQPLSAPRRKTQVAKI